MTALVWSLSPVELMSDQRAISPAAAGGGEPSCNAWIRASRP